jgi:hypothetical protein
VQFVSPHFKTSFRKEFADGRSTPQYSGDEIQHDPQFQQQILCHFFSLKKKILNENLQKDAHNRFNLLAPFFPRGTAP